MIIHPKRLYLLLEGQKSIVELEGRDVVDGFATWPVGFFGQDVKVVGVVGDFERVPMTHRHFFDEVRPGVFRRRASMGRIWEIAAQEGQSTRNRIVDPHFYKKDSSEYMLEFPNTLLGVKDPYAAKKDPNA